MKYAAKFEFAVQCNVTKSFPANQCEWGHTRERKKGGGKVSQYIKEVDPSEKKLKQKK